MNPLVQDAAASLGGLMLLVIFFMIAGAIFWIVSLIDVLKNDFTNPSNKTTWLLLLIFLAPIGTILYQLIGKGQKIDIGVIKDTGQKKEPEKIPCIGERNISHSKDNGGKWM